MTRAGLRICHAPIPALRDRGRKPRLKWVRQLSALVGLGLVCVVGTTGCSESNSRSDRPHLPGVLNVVTTTGMIGDLVLRIGGPHVQVTSLMGPGVDPHLYKASEGDVARMSSADLILYNGLHLEGAMADLFERMAGRIPTVAVTDRIDRTALLAPADFKGNFDPHVWFDVSLWMRAGQRVADALGERDPEHRDDYSARYALYAAELSDLHREVESRAAMLPPDRRVLITAHDAFNYFGRAYGFEVRGLQGISTAAEAGTADVQELAAYIADHRIPAIFVETSVPARSIEAVQAAVRARGFDVKIGGHLYSDALGNPDTPEGSYVGMIRYNTETIVSALANGSS